MSRPRPPSDSPRGARDGSDADDTIDADVAAFEPPGPRASGPSPGDYAELPTVASQHYVRGDLVAKGGVGRVVVARDRRLGRLVAIKELLPGRAHMRVRFEEEARITARLQHPAIVSVLEAGTWPDGEPFYAMTLVPGRSLDAEIARRPSLAERLALLPRVGAVADALAYAHSQGIVHRDLKPANVLVGDFGETVVIDWGLAKDLAAPRIGLPSGSMAAVVLGDEPGAVVGTPAYMPPEQARGEPVDERADVYALGAMLHHVLAGQPPYDHGSAREVLKMVIAGVPAPVDLSALGAPTDLCTIVAKAMARAREARYPSAAELADDLRRFQTGRLVAARHYGPGARLLHWLRRNRAPVGVAAVALAALLALAVVAVVGIVGERDVARRERRLAVEQEHEAEVRAAELFLEQARRESLDGHSGSALVYLQAARAHSDSPALRFLAQENLRSFARQEFVLEDGAPLRFALASPDDHQPWLLTAGASGMVRVWASGKRISELDHGAAVVHARWLPDGRSVIVAGDDGTLSTWDVQHGPRLRLDAQAGPVRAFDVDASGRVVVSAHGDGRLRVWHLPAEGDAPPPVLLDDREPRGDTLAVALSPDGREVAAAGRDGRVRVWAITGALRLTLVGHEDGSDVIGVAFSPDGTRLASAGADATARLWDARTGAPLATLAGHASDVRWLEFSRDGTRLLTASLDRTAAVWDARSGARLVVLAGHEDLVRRAHFSADGGRVLSASDDGTARLWDATTGAPLARYEGHRRPVRDATFDAHETRVLTASDDGTARVFSVDEGPARLPLPGGTSALAYAPDGTLAAAGTDGGVRYFAAGAHAPAGAPLADLEGTVLALAWADRGATLVAADDAGRIVSWDVRARTVRATHEHGAAVLAVAQWPGALASAGRDGFVRVWPAGDRPGRSVSLGGASVTALAAAPDGRRLWAASGRRVVALDTADLSQRGALPEQPGPIAGLALGPDGRTLVALSLASATLWDVSGAAPRALGPTLRGNGGRLWAAAWRPDGQLLATGSLDGLVELWAVDARGGVRLAARKGGAGAITSLAFSPDGTTLAAGGDDGSVYLWDLGVPADVLERLAAFVQGPMPWSLQPGGRAVRLEER